jgi:hypothetical protein
MADDEAHGKETKLSVKDELADNVVELAEMNNDGVIVHRKRRRKNVESKDAST